ncbi:MAG: glycosyltransferase family 4 protein [Proteobacteria bacterium]|nr:glycosyltransferase family 4 protein [Pseudomonadota bacterium]
MKICQLSAVDFTLYHFILPLMRAEALAGHEVIGVCRDGPWVDRVRAEGFRVEPVGFSRNLDLLSHLRAYRELTRLFEREGFDLVHVHTPIAGLIGRFAAHRASAPRIVYTAHGFYFHERMPAVKRAPFVFLEWLAGRVTDVLLTQSAEDATLARRYRLCRGGVIEAIGNGVDPARFFPAADAEARRAIRAALDTPAEMPVILMVGRLVAEKGYPELFEAMRAVEARLWIAGERLPSDHAPAIDRALAKVAADPILATRVQLLGHRTDMPDIYRAADVFVLPSHREGMPRSIIEAMMSGLPVVATEIRGAREEVVEGETGFLVPVGGARALGEGLARLVTDPALRARLGLEGRKRALALYDESKVISRQLALLGLSPLAAPADTPPS